MTLYSCPFIVGAIQISRPNQYALEYRKFIGSLQAQDIEGAKQHIQNMHTWHYNDDIKKEKSSQQEIIRALVGYSKENVEEFFEKFFLDSWNLLDAVFGFVQEYSYIKKFYIDVDKLLQEKKPTEVIALFEKVPTMHDRFEKLLAKYLMVKGSLKAIDVIQQALSFPNQKVVLIDRNFFDDMYSTLSQLRNKADTLLSKYQMEYTKIATEEKAIDTAKQIRYELADALGKLRTTNKNLYDQIKTDELDAIVTRVLQEKKEYKERVAQEELGDIRELLSD